MKNRYTVWSIVAPIFVSRNASNGNSQYIAGTNNNIDLSLENKEYYEMKKAPASGCKGLELGNRDLNPD